MSTGAFRPTAEQMAVISHCGSAFVTACPGAGKTRVMVERARRLFSMMPMGRGIAFLSFTRVTMFELEARLRQQSTLPSPAFPSYIGTFDSFVWQFLVAPLGVPGCDARPRLIPDLEDLPITPYPCAHPLPFSCFDSATGALDPEAANRSGFDMSQKGQTIVRRYEVKAAEIRQRLRERGQVGFDEARSIAIARLNDSNMASNIAKALAGRFSEIVVDEAQDCNPDDLHILAWLRDSGLPVEIVCDPHQSIFEFRGGVTRELLDFEETFDVEDRKRLTGNFRSAPNICKAIAQLRPPCYRAVSDTPLGPFRDEFTPVFILSYIGSAVPSSIGVAFCTKAKQAGLDPALCPILAATRATASAAAGQPRGDRSACRAARLARAVTDFHFAVEFGAMKSAIDDVHRILLEVAGQLDKCSYAQYLSENEIEEASWRPGVVSIVRDLRFDPLVHADAKAWHEAAKDLLARRIAVRDGSSVSQVFKWNDAVADSLASVPDGHAVPRTIHSVKGMEFPAVCVVTTASTLKAILDYLETGEPDHKAEEARKLYVAASRAERLLVVAAPKTQTERLARHLRGQGASVEIEDIRTPAASSNCQ